MFKNLILIIEQNLRIPNDIPLETINPAKIGNKFTSSSETDIYYDYREALQVIYQNFYTIKCFKSIIIQSLEVKFDTLFKDYVNYSLQDIEFPIQILSTIKDSIKESDELQIFKNLITFLLKLHGVLTNVSSESISILYFETITKYIFVYSKEQELVKEFLDVFFSKK